MSGNSIAEILNILPQVCVNMSFTALLICAAIKIFRILSSSNDKLVKENAMLRNELNRQLYQNRLNKNK